MDDLEKLHAQIADLQKKAEKIATERKAAVLEDVLNKVHTYGITAKDLGFHEKVAVKHTSAGSTVAVKYKQGSNTWTGRGRKPKFVVDYLATGGKLEDLLV